MFEKVLSEQAMPFSKEYAGLKSISNPAGLLHYLLSNSQCKQRANNREKIIS